MIATVCKSCDTVDRAIIDRCKYCGSKQVETKYVDNALTKYVANGREIIIVPKNK